MSDMRETQGRILGRPWQPGQSGNPAGRPPGSRQKIAEALLKDLAEVWQVHGKSVLERLAKEDPGKFATIAYGLLPRDIMLTVEHEASPFADMSPEQKRAIAHRIYADIEREAKVIEGEPSKE
jgi:hypothetical protein